MRRLLRHGALAAALAGLSAAQEPAPESEPQYQPLRGLERALWRPERAELWLLCREEGAESVRVLDPWLRELPAPAEPMPDGGVRAGADGALRMPAWAGRELLARADGSLRLTLRPWESAPRVVWGPGWAAVEARVASPWTEVLWRRAGDAEIRRAAVQGEPDDGILLRAHLLGLVPGERIEIAVPAPAPEFPPRAEPLFRAFVVPAVEPSGPRPTSEWPSE